MIEPLQPTQHPKLHSRFAALTGLRGIAILWVVFAHLPLKMGPMVDHFRHTWGIGVDMFLAISGFLVTRSLYECDLISVKNGKSAAFAAKEFLIRRVSRIFPPYFLVLGLIAALAMVDKGLYVRLASLGTDILGFVFFYSNYVVPEIRNQVPEVLAIAWSISFQEQFYLILVLLYLMSKRHLKLLLLCAGLASLVTRLYMVLFHWGGEGHTAQLQMWLHLRFDAISWSCLAWIYYDQLGVLWATPQRARVAYFGIFLSLALILTAHSLFPGDLNQAIIYCFKGPVLALVVRATAEMSMHRDFAISRFLSQPVFSQIGLVAFEIYLLNSIVMAALPRLGIASPAVLIPVAYLLSVGGGWVYYRVYGKPAKDIVRRFLPEKVV